MYVWYTYISIYISAYDYIYRIYIYIYIHICVCTYICMYIYNSCIYMWVNKLWLLVCWCICIPTHCNHTRSHWITLQHTATHCNIPWVHRLTLLVSWCICILTRCNTLQHIATWTHYISLHISATFHVCTCRGCSSANRYVHHHTATHCNTLQHIATHCNTLQHIATHCNTLQHIATQCNTLQHNATHCNTMQHIATHCNTLQKSVGVCWWWENREHAFESRVDSFIKAHFVPGLRSY